MAKKKESGLKPLTCYTMVRKKSGYFSLVKIKANDYEILKDAQETTQEQVFYQIDKEFHKMRLDLLRPEHKNEDGTVSI